MEMTEQIREIIDLDRRALAIMKDAEKISQSIELETEEIIKSRRKEVLEDTHHILKNNYDDQMDHAEKEKQRMLDDMSVKLLRVREAYHAHKEGWANEILELLLHQEG